MKKYIEDFQIVEKKLYKASFFTLVLKHKDKLPEIKSGQFVEISVNHPDVFLRRPISIHDVDYTNNTISLLIQNVGKGTAELSTLKEGDSINMIYPLGNGFSSLGNNVLLVGGGCGVAPLLYLARKFKEENKNIHLLLGGRSIDYIPALEEFRKAGQVYIATEDGSEGEKGLVTNHSIFNKAYDRIFCCGPNGMMKAIARQALERNIPCEVSLENTMACGVGACLCCVVKTDAGHKCVCSEGPIFEAAKLTEWIGYTSQEDSACSLVR